MNDSKKSARMGAQILESRTTHARSPAFEDTFDASRSPFSGPDIAVPVTVAFGDRDCIVTKCSQCRNGLPAHTRWFRVHGWGHVPMWVDPIGVSRLILDGTAKG